MVKDATEKLRLAWFSPQSEEIDSIASHWTVELLPVLEQWCEVEVYSDHAEARQSDGCFPYQIAALRHAKKPFDCCVYQLEDRRSAYPSRIHLGLIPGIVIFHDFVLSSDGPEQILNSPWQDTTALFKKYALSGAHVRWPNRDAIYKPQRPYAMREAAWAIIPVFSSPHHHAAFKRVIERRIAPEAPSYYLPHPVVDCGPADGVSATILCCASPHVSSHTHQLAAAMCELRAQYRFRWLVLDALEAAKAQSLMEEFGITSFEIEIGRSLQRWTEWVQAGGIALHLHYGERGAIGPYLARSLMAGLPTIVLTDGEGQMLPPHVAFGIEPGGQETRQLRAHLEVLLANDMGFDPALSAARVYARAVHDRVLVAAELMGIIRCNIARLRECTAHWRQFERQAQFSLIEENLKRDSLELPPALQFERLAGPVFRELKWMENVP